jgi:hypothetical protein
MEIHIKFKLRGDGFAEPDELELRNEIEELIEARGIGEFRDAGSGMGVMDLYIEVEDAEAALPKLRVLLREQGAEGMATLRVIPD